jgi:DNA polymerase elongation subunit (family B)
MLYTLFTFLDKRLEHKKLAKETGDKYHDDMSNALKILANSYYGFQSAPGLNFNYPKGAALITQKGREILTQAVKWASGKTVDEVFGSKEEVENDET